MDRWMDYRGKVSSCSCVKDIIKLYASNKNFRTYGNLILYLMRYTFRIVNLVLASAIQTYGQHQIQVKYRSQLAGHTEKITCKILILNDIILFYPEVFPLNNRLDVACWYSRRWEIILDRDVLRSQIVLLIVNFNKLCHSDIQFCFFLCKLAFNN